MLKMNKRNHGYKDIDRLIEKTLIKREKILQEVGRCKSKYLQLFF
ncbi:hypothetical protein Q5M85_09085 [Paraclostridium bifermentans]|nr:hypothetical protein [Paraclostridium bifermentans]